MIRKSKAARRRSHALRRMWDLVESHGSRWVIFVSFTSLIIAALSEISIPSILAESIFAAQSSDAVVFSRNSKILAFLCITLGMCSGLRSGCFGIANIILMLIFLYTRVEEEEVKKGNVGA